MKKRLYLRNFDDSNHLLDPKEKRFVLSFFLLNLKMSVRNASVRIGMLLSS